MNYKKIVLVIEDDKFIREMLVAKLKKADFETIEAMTGEEGLQIIKERKPNLILLDIILPGITGFDVLEEVKKDDEISQIPVVVLSNFGQPEDIEKGLRLGAKEYIIKAHLSPMEVVKKAKEILSDN